LRLDRFMIGLGTVEADGNLVEIVGKIA